MVSGTCFLFSLASAPWQPSISVLTHIENRCDTIRDWIRGGSDMKTIEPTRRFSDAHLRSHFLRIMARFLSRNKTNTSGWAPVVVAGKDDRAVKAREDGKRMLQFAPLSAFFFHPSCTSSNSPDCDYMFPRFAARENWSWRSCLRDFDGTRLRL